VLGEALATAPRKHELPRCFFVGPTERRSHVANGPTVLIAEDETIIRLDLRTQLEAAGYLVCGEAQTGEQA
jgi:hypothetical protein